MIDDRIKLTILEDNNTVITDHSADAVDFLRDTLDVTLADTTDYLYVGYYKPINSLYCEIATPNLNSSEINVEVWDGDTWVMIPSRDETKHFTRSGFITWDRQDAVVSANQITVNGITQEWYRLSVDVTLSTVTFNGINLVFADDETLKVEFPSITDPRILTAGFSSNIVHHVAARNSIVQDLRQRGYIKFDSDNKRENLTQWDLLDIYEIKEAAKYLALSKIFFMLSDSAEDSWWAKHKEYNTMYMQTMEMARLTFDTNDDGEADDSENLAVYKSIRVSR